MVRLRTLVLVSVLLAPFLTGCDSSDDEKTDAEILAGNWIVTKVEDGNGDQTARLEQEGVLSVQFTATNYTIRFDAIDDSENQSATGTYTLDDARKKIVLVYRVLNVDVPVNVDYVIENEDGIVLSLSADVINLVLGTEYTGSVKLTFKRA